MVFIILSYLLLAAVTTILPRLISSNRNSPLKSLRFILFHALFMDHQRLPHVHLKLMLLFFGLFLFFNLNFLSGTITTEKCTVPTDEIVDSPSKLIATSIRVAIHFEEVDLLRGAPENSFLRKLSRKTILPVKGLGELSQMKTTGIDNYVIFAVSDALIYFVAFLNEHANEIGAVAYIGSNNYHESLSVFHMRRSLDGARKRFIDSR